MYDVELDDGLDGETCFEGLVQQILSPLQGHATEVPLGARAWDPVEHHRHLETILGEEAAHVRVGHVLDESTQGEDVGGGRVPLRQEVLHHVVHPVGTRKNLIRETQPHFLLYTNKQFNTLGFVQYMARQVKKTLLTERFHSTSLSPLDLVS